MAAVNVTFPGNLAQVETAQDLRSIPSALIASGDLYLVNGLQGLFEYDTGSVSADDGTDVIRPYDKTPLQAGRWIRNVDGLASGPTGATGPADNTYTSYAVMQASDPTRKSARLVGDTDVPPHPDGPYSNPTQTVGGWIAQPADGVDYGGRSVADKLFDIISIRDAQYAGGAKGDYLTNPTRDDTAAIQACLDAATLSGATVVWPHGFFRVTKPLRVGQQMFSDYATVINRTVAMGYEDTLASRNASALAANKLLKRVSLRFEGAVIVADFAPSQPTPVLEYNIPHERGSASITGTGIITIPARVNSDGYRGHDGQDGPISSNNLIGFATTVPTITTFEGLTFGGLKAGAVLIGPFWMNMRDVRTDNCVDSLHLFTANAFTFENVQLWEGQRGVIYDGDGSRLSGLRCQQIVQELTVISAVATEFGPGWYLEDAGSAASATAAMRFAPNEPNQSRIVGCTVRDVHVGSTRPGKWPVLVNGAGGTGIHFIGVVDSAVGTSGLNGAFFDGNSIGRLTNCNGSFVSRFPRNRFPSKQGPTGDITEFEPAVSYYGTVSRPNQILPAIAGGTLAAGAVATGTLTLNITQTKAFTFFSVMQPHLLSGGDPKLILKITGMGTGSVDWMLINPTSASITYTAATYLLCWQTLKDIYA